MMRGINAVFWLMISTTSSLYATPLISADPYEKTNRKIFNFNAGLDKAVLKPIATIYKTIIPAPIRAGINNAYNNVNMLPTVANDLLQRENQQAIKDTWRFIINSTVGIAGIFDVANRCGLPPHSNDLGITFAKWGDQHSPYIVIPFLGPSTIRDGMGLMFDYALFTPYPYIRSYPVLYGLLGLRYIDLRSQMLDTDKIIAESFDQYAFVRDAYLQHRQYLLDGGNSVPTDQEDTGLYVDEDTQASSTKKAINKVEFPLTTN